MSQKTFKEVPAAKVGETVQRFVRRKATSITCKPDALGTWTVVVVLPD